MSYFTFAINNNSGTNIITGSTDRNSTVYITGLEGWDDFEGFEIETAPLLSGVGSAELNTRIAERNVTAVFFVRGNYVLYGREYYNALFDIGKTFQPVTLVEQYYSDGSTQPARTVSISGKITSVSLRDGNEDGVYLEVSILCINPLKNTQ